MGGRDCCQLLYLQVSGHLVCSRLLTLWILYVPSDFTLLSPFSEIGKLTSHLPPGGLRVSGRQRGVWQRGREKGVEGKEGGRGSKDFLKDK